ncbi:MAG TPA: ABC transporter substrate-binding protein, partial [Alteromonas australica]|nr:ABC transporter substrate-binding protein [Alteromonas australica]
MRISSLGYVAFIATLLAVLSACTKRDEQAFYNSGLIYCSESNPVTFNPQLDTSSTTADATAHQIYDRLLDFDPETGRIVPSLASSWLVSDDGLTYAFQLRRDVQFHTTD